MGKAGVGQEGTMRCCTGKGLLVLKSMLWVPGILSVWDSVVGDG